MNTKLNANRLQNLIVILVLILITSCASRQDVVYFQDEVASESDTIAYFHEISYKTDDMLTIDVSAIDPEAAKPFNLAAVSYNTESVISAQGSLKMQTYLLDANGNIEFPVIGTLKLGGLTRAEATLFLKEKLAEYIKDPIVNIRLANFTITVLGEVNKPGTFTVADERISLSEALGLAGDLTIWGKRDNVFLIRENNGKKQYAKLDLTSIKVLNSPNYYLAQNDVIYVEPNSAKVKQSAYNQNSVVWISAIATLATIAAIVIR
ncbi:sugar transporter [Flavobacteriales bacterium 34_180_T64]|nr:sugar transporter [Flavobacteriales bacterium 34_180_T64]